jgi:hypothetical protein
VNGRVPATCHVSSISGWDIIALAPFTSHHLPCNTIIFVLAQFTSHHLPCNTVYQPIHSKAMDREQGIPYAGRQVPFTQLEFTHYKFTQYEFTRLPSFEFTQSLEFTQL